MAFISTEIRLSIEAGGDAIAAPVSKVHDIADAHVRCLSDGQALHQGGGLEIFHDEAIIMAGL